MSTPARDNQRLRPSRFAPPDPGAPPPIDRPRLTELVEGRFDRRLTIVVGPAGFGKSTLLAQAVAANAASSRGIDVWLGCAPTDDAESELAAGLLRALGHAGPVDDRLRAVVDAVWARAPNQVALVLDDAHLIGDGSSGAAFLGALVEALPANGHLVLGSRLLPSFPLSRLRATRELLVVDEGGLTFDDTELARFADARAVDIAVVDRSGGWPALAEFQCRVVTSCGDSPWQQLLAEVDPDRRRALIRLAPFTDFDDELVRVVTGLDVSAASLVEGLPLVSADTAGVRMHDLWRDALLEGPPLGADEGVRAGAALLQVRGRAREGFDALDRSGDRAGIEPFVAAFARTDFPEASAEDLRHILKGLPDTVADGGYGALLRGAMLLGEDGAAALEALVEATELLAASGDHEGEAVALVRRVMVHFWQADLTALGPVLDRLRALANSGIARAARSIELSEAYALLIGGHPREAVERVTASGAMGDPATAPLAGFLLAGAGLDLGQPARTLQETAHILPQAVGRTRAGLLGVQLEARCLQRLPAEPAYRAWRQELEVLVTELGVIENLVLLAAGGVLMELYLGRAEQAAHQAELARVALPSTVGRRARIAVGVAEAAILVASGDEAAAARRLEVLLDEVPLTPRPDRAYLRVLPMLYLLAPEVRPVLDEADLGPLWSVGRRVAHALVATRAGDIGPATDLDWSRPEEIQALTLPVHVVELATAAVAGGNEAAGGALAGVPIDVRAGLTTLIEGEGVLEATARRLLQEVAGPPRDSIEIRVLGPVQLRRGGVAVDEAAWRRERVRALLAHLVVRRLWTRAELAAALWPDLDEQAGINNLRVNLRHLQSVLQPDLALDEPPWFVRVADDRIALVASDHLTVDADDFEAHLEAGWAADDGGVPGAAMDHLLRALDLYRGEYLEAMTGPAGVEFDRLRLRSGFVRGAIRAGELLLGLGHHRRAIDLAGRAVTAEPVNEAAHRLLARAMAAGGDKAGAIEVLDDACARLRAEGLEPEAETNRCHAELAATG